MVQGTAVAYMHHGAWVARCPVCSSTERAGRCDDGQPGGLEASRFTCIPGDPDAPLTGLILPRRGCGWRGPVEWPPNIADLERVLLARPLPVTRNWFPGETVFDLLRENAEHGIVPAAALEGNTGGGWLLRLEDDRLTSGTLDFVTAPLQIGA